MRKLVVLSVTLLQLAAVGCGSSGDSTASVEDLTKRGDAARETASDSSPATETPVVQCAGDVIAPPAGLRKTTDDALLTSALGASGKGKLCKGNVFEVTGAVTVHRVWNSAKSYTQIGSWWSFTAPKGPVEAYRADNEICKEWSDLDVVSHCKVKLGAKIVVGPGQSADCANDVTYPKSATNQVFIPNDARNGVMFVEECSAGTPWPAE